MTAEKVIFISKDYQRAMAMDGSDNFSLENRLTKGDGAPPAAPKTHKDIRCFSSYWRDEEVKIKGLRGSRIKESSSPIYEYYIKPTR